MNDFPRESPVEVQSALSRLTALVCSIPAPRRSAILQSVASFRPYCDLDCEFAIGQVRAAFADCWELEVGSPVPLRTLRELLTPPVPIKTVQEFTRLNSASSYAEVESMATRLLRFLAAEIRKTTEESQQLLFPCMVAKNCESAKRKTAPLLGGDLVYSLEELVEAGRKFATIYADPPWAYDNIASRAAAQNHYGTMKLAEICDLPVSKLSEENAHLHLWTTNGFLRQAFDVLNAWGFVFKSCLVWIKNEIGMGNYWRVSHEFLLLGVRGNLTFADRRLPSWIRAPRSIHSRKPDVVRTLIERASPGPYLELFGREELPNSQWTVFGNQIERRLF